MKPAYPVYAGMPPMSLRPSPPVRLGLGIRFLGRGPGSGHARGRDWADVDGVDPLWHPF